MQSSGVGWLTNGWSGPAFRRPLERALLGGVRRARYTLNLERKACHEHTGGREKP
jgi:hypothetical protein